MLAQPSKQQFAHGIERAVRQSAEFDGFGSDIIRGLRDRGVAVILVSHNIKQVLELSDRVYAFRRGSIVCNLATKQTDADEIISYITGARS